MMIIYIRLNGSNINLVRRAKRENSLSCESRGGASLTYIRLSRGKNLRFLTTVLTNEIESGAGYVPPLPSGVPRRQNLFFERFFTFKHSKMA